MICSVHQPHYFPYLGYFKKLLASDLFIFYDDAQFTKNNYINRNRYMIKGNVEWFTLPVVKTHLDTPITEKRVVDYEAFKTSFITKLKIGYKGSPHLEEIIDFLSKYNNRDPLYVLAESSICFLRRKAESLGIKVPGLYYSRSLEYNRWSSNSEKLADMVKYVGADCYLSGPTGRDYLDEKAFSDRELEVKYHVWQPPDFLSTLHHYLTGDLWKLI